MIRAIAFLLFSFAAAAQQYVISTFAGGVPPVTPAAAAGVSIGDPPRVAVDAAGNIYFGSLHAIYKVDRSGTLLRIAGAGRAGQTSDGPALATELDYPVGIAVDPAGTIYYAERNGGGLLRRIASGAISSMTVEGVVRPMGIRSDSAGNLYLADMAANVIRKLSTTGAVTIVAGNGTPGFSGDGGPATAASLNGPEGMTTDPAGNLYIADTFNHRVRVVAPDGTISTFAGTGFPGYGGDDGPASSGTMILPTDVAVDAAGNVYIADLGNSRVRKVTRGVITTLAGNSGGLPPRDGLAATAVRLAGPTGLAVDAQGAVYIAEGSIGSGSELDRGSFRIWKVVGDRITSAAGVGLRSFSGDGGPAALAQFDAPAALAYDGKGNLYIADSQNHRIRRIAPDGVVTTVAGNALPGFSGDGGPATSAELNRPTGVAVDSNGNIYIADSGNNRVRMVFASGIIGTLAGNGNTALFGDGGNSALAALNRPQGVAVDSSGAVYIADTGNHCIRRVVNAVIDTVASGLRTPIGVAVDDSGSIWVADAGDGTVRQFLKGGTLTAALPGARGIAIDAGGRVFAAGTDRVVRVESDGSLTTIAGSGQCCYSGDGGPAGAARLNGPWGVVSDSSGNLYIADSGNDAIRVATVSATTFFIRSVANGASNLAGAVASGEVVTIYGAGLGPATLVGATLTAPPTDLAGTRVLVNGTPAQILYTSAGQVSAVMPPGLSGARADIVVQFAGAATSAFPVAVVPAAPGIFTADSTGGGLARALNADGTPNGRANPAVAGLPLTFFLTGDGGAQATVTIGGQPAEIQNASRPYPGVTQVTVTVPREVIGQAALVVTVGGVSSQTGVSVVLQ
ncbi:MAG TPA: IPT/TIG domain-containing protein [Gemmataceae bacterium]|nr:IPT/TIG domain-containing protein [Gemmataceae bacterium]